MSPYSAAPGTPQTTTKAVVSAVVSFVAVFLVALWATVKDRTDLDTMKASDWFLVILGSLVTAIVTGGATLQARNRPL